MTAYNDTRIQEYENDIIVVFLHNLISCITMLAFGMLVFILHDYEVRYKMVSIAILPVIQNLVFHVDLLFSFNFAALRDSAVLGQTSHMRVEDSLHWRRKSEVQSMVRQAVERLQLPQNLTVVAHSK